MFDNKKEDNRFNVVKNEKFGTGSGVQILVDKETGIEYLLYTTYGITVILDRDGKPKINKEYL